MVYHDRSAKLERNKKRFAPARSSGSLYHEKDQKSEARRIAGIVERARK